MVVIICWWFGMSWLEVQPSSNSWHPLFLSLALFSSRHKGLAACSFLKPSLPPGSQMASFTGVLSISSSEVESYSSIEYTSSSGHYTNNIEGEWLEHVRNHVKDVKGYSFLHPKQNSETLRNESIEKRHDPRCKAPPEPLNQPSRQKGTP